MQFEHPFTGQPVDADPPFGYDADAHGLDPADADYWEALAAADLADEPVVCAGPDVPIERCPVCGPLLVVAIAEDVLDDAA